MSSRQIILLLAGTIAIIFENINAGMYMTNGLLSIIQNLKKVLELYIKLLCILQVIK